MINHEKNMENFLDWTPQNHLKCRQCLRKTKEQPLVWGSPVLRNTQVKKVRNNWIFKSSGLILGYSRALLWRNPFHLYIYTYLSSGLDSKQVLFHTNVQIWVASTLVNSDLQRRVVHGHVEALKCSDHPAMGPCWCFSRYFPQSGVHELQVIPDSQSLNER